MFLVYSTIAGTSAGRSSWRSSRPCLTRELMDSQPLTARCFSAGAPGAEAAGLPTSTATLLLPDPAAELGASITGVKVSAAPRAAAMAPTAPLGPYAAAGSR